MAVEDGCVLVDRAEMWASLRSELGSLKGRARRA
jgi:hypothetical protein